MPRLHGEGRGRAEGAVTNQTQREYSLKFASRDGENISDGIARNLLELLNRNIPGGIMGGYLEDGFPLFCVNDYMLNHLGFTYDEFVADIDGLVINCMHPEDRARVDRAVEEAFSQNLEYEVQYRMRKKDGSYIWINDIGRKVRTEAGEEVCVSTIRDITQKERHIAEIERQKALYRSLFESAVCGIVQYKLAEEGQVEFKSANREAIRIFGYSADAFWKKKQWNLNHLIDEQDRERILREISRIREVGDKQAYEYRLSQQDGSPCWIIGTAELIRDLDGEVVMQSVFMDVDQRKKAELRNIELLRENRASSELLRMTLEGTEICEFSYYPQLNRADIPERTRRIYGCKPRYENMAHAFAQEMVLEEDREAYFDVFRRIHAGERYARAEFRSKDHKKWVRMTLSTVEYDTLGQPVTTVGLVEDIMRQKRTETERTELSKLNQEILTSLSDLFFGVYRLNLREGTIRVIRRPDGLEDGSVGPGDSPYCVEQIAEFYHPDERPAYCRMHSLENLRALKAQGIRSISNEFRRRVNGEFCWVMNTAYLNAHGADDDSVVLALMDVSERRRQDEIIAALSREYYALYYINLGRDTYQILRADPYVMQKMDLHQQGCYSRMIDAYVRQFVHPSQQEEMNAFFNLNRFVQAHGQLEQSRVYRKRQPDGRYAWMQARLMLGDEDGVARHVTFAIRDVDGDMRRELETKQLLEDALRRAESANAAKSDFLSHMSHDIRTPMNAIVGMTALANTYLDDTGRVRDCLDKISVSSKHLLGLINEVLDMSKIESGKLDLERRAFNLTDVMREAVCMMQPASQEKRQELRLSVQAVRHAEVMGDALRLKQVLSNLLSNAVKYTPERGAIHVNLQEMASKSASHGRYVLTVEDDGIGMREAFIEHIFEPFSRADDSRVSRTAGTGLGMAITQNIVHMMGGEITVQSEWGKGSRFTVAFELELTQGQTAKASPALAQERPRFDGRRFLIAEDNTLNLEITTEFVKLAGAEAEAAVDGAKAVEAFTKHAPGYYDAILMDIQMPLMNGYEATRAIRALKRPDAARIPIIAMTANAFASDVQRARKAGMDAHVAKPVDMGQLLSVLRQFVHAADSPAQ